ncbi:MAG: GatB/YqeY domain-containing protein [Cytophagales bacterium]|nr:GatB/YqeY domain-containing protein [Cytophagales bacterium]
MSLRKQVEADMKKAMLAKEKDKLKALRAIKSLILLAEKEENVETLTEEQEVKLLLKAVKQRKDSAEIYEQQNREDLKAVEVFEANIIEEYLPKMMDEAEVKEAIQAIIEKVGASGPSDMGKVMGVATKELAGKAEGKVIATTTKQLLNQ